jgi:hypothetical protein
MHKKGQNAMSNPKTAKPNSTWGDAIFRALAQQEIASLLDALFAALPLDMREAALDRLLPDTKQTVQRILAATKTTGHTRLAQPVSTAKLEQTWSKLWQEWDGVVSEAAQENGQYMVQDEHWEPPYFDQTAFIHDLEQVAKRMRPLIQTAVQNGFSPDEGLAESLSAAEDDISAAMPDWIEINEDFYLEENLTHCLLEWEWLTLDDEGGGAFAESILDWEETFTHVVLDDDAFLDFFAQLPEADQEAIFKGLAGHKDTPPWKGHLEDVHSHWHNLYMHYAERYAPEQYLHNLRTAIPQQWQDGLPVIEDLLSKRDYGESLKVIQETLAAMLKIEQMRQSWAPETSLLFARVNRYGDDIGRLESYKTWLDYYRQTANGLGQTHLAAALSLQLIAFDQCFNWEAMLRAFEEVDLSQPTRQALLTSWRDYIVKRAKPHSWGDFRWKRQPHDIEWLHWLIESIVDGQKGPAWFQHEMARWLTDLPGDQPALGEDFDFLRLLTKDLTEISGTGKCPYPQFYEAVIRPGELSSPDRTSRQAYLKRYAAGDLLGRVMAYWKTHLQNFVPRPEAVHKSDYTHHAQWMAALRELAPRSYEALRDRWRVEHPRRRNLWEAMSRMGLE